MTEFSVMEKLAKKCARIAKKSWIEETGSNSNLSEADKRAIAKMANTLLKYCIENLQYFINHGVSEQ